ncbi:MAG: UbiD family decarboxylase [Geobacter sp.]|nr:UbiD family decarboxylase [Geobacter sp.]
MAFCDLRDFLSRLDELGELHRVPVTVDPMHEIAAITCRACRLPAGGPALLFQQALRSAFPVVTNLFGSKKRMAAALGVERLEELTSWLRGILDREPGSSALERLTALAASNLWQRATPQLVSAAPCREVREDPPDLSRFPVLKSWPLDGAPDHAGRFITLPLVITADPAGRETNCGMYRVAVLGPDRLAIHWGESSGAAAHARAWQTGREPMPVAIAVGGDPAVTFAATLPLPKGIDEFRFAGLLRGEPVELAPCLASGLQVPAGAELVIEGVIHPGETARDGAFGNHTGYYAEPLDAPLVRVTSISRRRDMLFPATVVGPPPMEDCWLAAAAERLILSLLQIDVPQVCDMYQPHAGIFHGGTIVAVRNAVGGGGELLARLGETPWLGRSRLLVLVDAEQSPADIAGVYWRIMNNVAWERDLRVDGERLFVDATRKDTDTRTPLRPDDGVEALVGKRWREYGFDDGT